MIVHDKKLSKPLHKLPSKELKKLALDQFDQINNFISEKPKSDKASSLPIENIIQSFLDTILKNPEIIDETYCLLMKQMTNNKSKESVLKGFQLLICCIHCHLPRSRELTISLGYWLQDFKNSYPAQVWFCLQSMQKILARKAQRKLTPSLQEIGFIRNMSPILCRLSTIDGSQKGIYVDSTVTVQEAIHTFFEKLQIPFHVRDLYYPVILTSQAGTTRDINVAGLICDLLRAVELYFASQPASSDFDKKIYMKQLVFIGRKSQVKDAFTNKLLYNQTKVDVHNGVLRCTEAQAIQLAGLQAQIEMGNFDEEKTYFINSLLPNYIHQTQSDEEYWVKKVNTAHLSWYGMSTEESVKRYVSVVQMIPFFGCFLLPITIANAGPWKFGDNKYTLCINEEGISFLQNNTPHKKFFYRNIIRWHLGKENQNEIEILTADNLFPLKLETNQPHEAVTIARLLNGYVIATLNRSPIAIALEDHHPDKSDPENFDLLTFNKGDIIKVLVHNQGNNWLFGEVLGTEKGNFPLELVKFAISK